MGAKPPRVRSTVLFVLEDCATKEASTLVSKVNRGTLGRFRNVVRCKWSPKLGTVTTNDETSINKAKEDLTKFIRDKVQKQAYFEVTPAKDLVDVEVYTANDEGSLVVFFVTLQYNGTIERAVDAVLQQMPKELTGLIAGLATERQDPVTAWNKIFIAVDEADNLKPHANELRCNLQARTESYSPGSEVDEYRTVVRFGCLGEKHPTLGTKALLGLEARLSCRSPGEVHKPSPRVVLKDWYRQQMLRQKQDWRADKKRKAEQTGLTLLVAALLAASGHGSVQKGVLNSFLNWSSELLFELADAMGLSQNHLQLTLQ